MKPYAKRNKTDAADAEAICEAVACPNMRFAPIKTVEQQGILALHLVRSLLVRQRTAAVNAARGLLAKFGVVAGKGIQRVDELRRRMDDLGAELVPCRTRTALNGLFAHIDALHGQVATIDARILAWHRFSAGSQRLTSPPGLAPMTASAMVAAVGDGRQFQSARHLAAWLSRMPRIKGSGGKKHIGRISKPIISRSRSASALFSIELQRFIIASVIGGARVRGWLSQPDSTRQPPMTTPQLPHAWGHGLEEILELELSQGGYEP